MGRRIGIHGVFIFLVLTMIFSWLIAMPMYTSEGGLDSLGLTESEKQWLKENPVIKVAPDLNYAPIEFLEDDEVKGIAIDYLHWFEERYPIKFMILRYPTWNAQLDAIRDKKIDLLSAAARTPSRMEYMEFTDPFILTPNVLLRRSDAPPIKSENDLFGMKIAAVGGYAVQEFMRLRFPEIEVGSVDTVQKGMEKISTGELDAFVCEYYVASYYLKIMSLENIAIETQFDIGFPMKLSMAARKDAPELASILNKMIRSMPEKEKQDIEARWIGGYESITGLSKIVRVMGIGIIISLIFAVGFIFLSWLLERKVKEQTRALKELNENLEEKVERRTYLLSETNKQLEFSMYQLQQKEEELAKVNLELEVSLENLTQSQKRLVEIEKVAALGNLVSTVAHELNTPLGNITTAFTFYIEQVERMLTGMISGKLRKSDINDLNAMTLETRDIVTGSLQRLNELIIRFKSLAVRTSVAESEWFDLIRSVKDWLELHSYTHEFIGEVTGIENGEKVGEFIIYGHKQLFQEIFENLINNSLVHGKSEGQVSSIEIRIVFEKTENRFRIHYSDNGMGVDEMTAKRMLEPLFSTKKMSGIGMSIVANIVHYAFDGDLKIHTRDEIEEETSGRWLNGFAITVDIPLHTVMDTLEEKVKEQPSD